MDTMATPGFGVLYELGAVFTCLVSCHASLLLAAASVRLRLPLLMVLTALQFCVQSIFSLHFIAMCGMRMGLDWGFDMGLTLASLATVALFGTSGLTLALWLRQRLQPAIDGAFPDFNEDHSFAFYGRLLGFILARAPLWQLLIALVLMVTGAAGCHHLGMWSMHGMAGAEIAAELTIWSCVTTAGVGGAVCTLAVLAFLLVPEGLPGALTAVLLTAGIAAFHYSSVIFGMRYRVGVEGITTRWIIGEEAVMVFVMAQVAVSQNITSVFSRMAITDHNIALKQLDTAQTLGRYIADMDLEPAKAIQFETHNPTMLEVTLFQIVNNLAVYRPYLPDTLFHHPDAPDLPQGPNEDFMSPTDRRPSRAPSSTNTSFRAKANPYRSVSHQSIESESDCRSDSTFGRRPTTRFRAPSHHTISPTPMGRRGTRNFSLGLKSSRLAVLRIHLQGLEFGTCKSLNAETIEERLRDFLVLTTMEIRAHAGTVVSRAGTVVTAMWTTICPDAAVDCALAIQQQSELPVVGVVQCGSFLAGNLAADQLRAFSLVGPLDWVGQQLLRLGGGQSHVLITTPEWEAIRLKYRCLPLEHVIVAGVPTTVFAVQPGHRPPGPNDHEWMYAISDGKEQRTMDRVDRAWQLYVAGQYGAAADQIQLLHDVPVWYPVHLQVLLEQASRQQAPAPVKCLDSIGWPQPQAIGVISPEGVPQSQSGLLREI